MLPSGTILDGRFEIIRTLGQGGMGTVYQARHTALGSFHAVKIMLPELLAQAELRDRFLMEGQTQAQLRHPNIVPVTDIIQAAGIAGLVMEFIDGVSLDEWMAGRTPLSPPEALRVVIPLCAALGYAHQSGIIHRDLKPENIVMVSGPDGITPRVLDFGIAKYVENESAIRRKYATIAGVALGTPAYMSPEQIRAPATVDRRTDVFALGAIAYELLTGQIAFQGGEPTAIMARVVLGERKSLRDANPGLPTAVAAAVERALATSKEARWDTCEAFAAALVAATTRQTIPELTAAVSPDSQPSPRPNWALLLAAISLVGGLATGLLATAWAVWGGGPEIQPAPAPSPDPVPQQAAMPDKQPKLPSEVTKTLEASKSASKSPIPSTPLPFACTEGAIAGWNIATLDLHRNEIYARHGHVFKRADLDKYFRAMPWYQPNPEFVDATISEEEKACVTRLKERQTALGG